MRIRESKCKLCRQLNTKLFLKGERCYTEKCSLERKKPQQRRTFSRRRKSSIYGQQLKEKQRLRCMYGLSEKELKKYYQMAGKGLFQLLERRLDRVVYLSSLGFSLPHARQLVIHGHFLINGLKVDIPSYIVKEGDKIEVRKESKKLSIMKQILEISEKRVTPEWLEVNRESLSARVKRFPLSEEANRDISLPLIIGYYSR